MTALLTASEDPVVTMARLAPVHVPVQEWAKTASTKELFWLLNELLEPSFNSPILRGDDQREAFLDEVGALAGEYHRAFYRIERAAEAGE